MANIAILQLKNTVARKGPASHNFWREVFRNLWRSRSAMAGALILGLLLLMATFAPMVATHNPLQSMIGVEAGKLPEKAPCIPIFKGQESQNEDGQWVVQFLGQERLLSDFGIFGCLDPLHWLGLDRNARDLFSRIVYGAWESLRVGLYSTLFAIMVGTLLGLFAGYAGRWPDSIIMSFMDILLAFPGLLLAITFVTIRGPGLENALLAISITLIPIYARITRASVLSVKEQEFVTAVRALGAPPLRIMFRHILPHALTPLIVQSTLNIGASILSAAALSFLGLGAQPPTPEWGQMLSEGRAYIFAAPHLVFFPGLMIMLTVLGFNLLGDGLRDALDPRLTRSR